MKTMKRLLAALLCICLTAGTCTVCVAAEEPEPSFISLSAPKPAVTKSEGLTVFELTFDFFENDANEEGSDASAEPVFTEFDEAAVLQGYVIFFKFVVAEFTAKPVSYDAQDGLLTVALFNKDGTAGLKMFEPAETPYESMHQMTTDIMNLMRLVISSELEYAFSFPEGMLRSGSAASKAVTWSIDSYEFQNISTYSIELFGKNYYKMMDRLAAWAERNADKVRESNLAKWTGPILVRFIESYLNGLTDISSGKFTFKSVAPVLIFIGAVMPIAFPALIRYFRTIKTIAMEYDPNWSFLKALFRS